MQHGKRVIHRLKGGLGNQLLQLLAMESLDYNVILDVSSGFHYDGFARRPTTFLNRLGYSQLKFPRFVLVHRWLAKGFVLFNCLFRLRSISESYYFDQLNNGSLVYNIQSFRKRLGINLEKPLDLVIHYRDFLAEGSFEYENISFEWIEEQVEKLDVKEILLIGNNIVSLKKLKVKLLEGDARNVNISRSTAERDFVLLSSANNKILSYSTFSLAAGLMSKRNNNIIRPKINQKLEYLVPLYKVLNNAI